jgi:hypothetical protein
MDVLQLIAENKIKTAQAEGVFDDLEGKGRPVHLDDIHPAGDDRFMANHILKTNHFLPVWLEDRKKLQQEIASCAEVLRKGMPISEEKQEAIRQLNRRISGYNLRVPVDSLRLMPVPVPEK